MSVSSLSRPFRLNCSAMFGGGGGSAPSPPPPPPPPAPPPVDEEEIRRLARQRRALEAKRAGRRSLRIDLPGPGITYPTQMEGLRLPE